MKWPWVSRHRLDDVRTGAEATIAFWKERAVISERELATWKSVNEQMFAELKAAQGRYVAIVDRVIAPPKPPDITPQIERVPSIVTQAIKDESGGDPRLAAHLRKRALELKAEGKTPEEVVNQLSAWQSTEEETAA